MKCALKCSYITPNTSPLAPTIEPPLAHFAQCGAEK